MSEYLGPHKLRLYAAEKLKGVLPYTSYEVGQEEFLGKFGGSVDQCVTFLKSKGYNYQMLAATKKLDGEIDEASFARIPETHPSDAEGTALSGISPKECQYHVHLFDKGNKVLLYGHYEVHPYPHKPTWDVSRMYPRHYRPTWDRQSTDRSKWTYLRGVKDPLIKDVI